MVAGKLGGGRVSKTIFGPKPPNPNFERKKKKSSAGFIFPSGVGGGQGGLNFLFFSLPVLTGGGELFPGGGALIF